MTEENNDVWRHNSLEVNEDNEVVGSAYTFTFGDGYDVQVGVLSYTYEKNGETGENHVPNVVVVDESGRIEREIHAHDSENPREAVENAKGVAEDIYNNPDRYGF